MVSSRMRWLLFLGVTVTASAQAAETITYRYDARGRLIQVIRTGTVNNGTTSTYAHDKANNRTNVTVVK